MCDLGQGIYKQGIEQGEIKALVTSIKKLMCNLGFTLEKAMLTLEIDEKYNERIKEFFE